MQLSHVQPQLRVAPPTSKTFYFKSFNFFPLEMKYVLAIFLFALCHSVRWSFAQPRSSFGESCDNFIRCDSSSHLGCLNGTCACLKPNEMTFDRGRSKCLVIPGERCYQTVIDTDSGELPGPFDCVPNASCNKHGYCECGDNYFEGLEDGLCKEKLNFGSNCTRHTECGRLSGVGLSCVNGKCSCDDTRSVYDPHLKDCRALAGDRRRPYKSCVEFASENVVGECGCSFNFYATAKGLCAPKSKLRGSCTRDGECAQEMDHQLICVDGKCSCDQKESVFLPGIGKCAAKAGVPFAKYELCVPNATPLPQISFIYGRTGMTSRTTQPLCVCDTGFAKSASGLCSGLHGSACHRKTTPPAPCHSNFICKNGKCACHFPKVQETDTSGRQCISQLKGPCKETIQGRQKEFGCVSGASCKKSDAVYECKCEEGFINSVNNTCKKIFGSECESSGECDQVPGAILQCINGICDCEDLEIHDGSKCRGLFGAPCDPRGERKFCMDGSFCEANRFDEGTGTCSCLPDAEVDSMRKCVRKSVQTDVLLVTKSDENTSTGGKRDSKN